MNLPIDFHFSASNLQDYVTCERRFLLKYIEQLLWPALPSQPVQEQEKHMQNGVLFHQFVYQYLLGIPVEQIEALIRDLDVLQWWHNFLVQFPDEMRGQFVAQEYTLHGILNGFPLLAKLDAIHRQDDIWTIFDWKTGFHLPKVKTMQDKIQSRLYPYMLAKFGARLNQDQPIPLHHIRMVYWFPEFPEEAIQFTYSEHQYQEDEAMLSSLMQAISAKASAEFLLTENERNCIYCVYRSLCGRGTAAGEFSAQAEDEPSGDALDQLLDNLDFDQIAEIAF